MQPDAFQPQNPTPVIAPPTPPSPAGPGSQPPGRWRPSYRAVRTMVLLAVFVLVMGWIGLQSLLHPKSKTPTTTQATVASDAASVCSEGARLKSAAYQAGTGQPMALYTRSSTAANHYQGVYTLGMAPIHTSLSQAYMTVGKNLSFTYSGKKTPVIVSCITRSKEQPTDQVCHYDDGKNISVYTASYHLTVYEASTRKVLRSIDVPAEQTYTCQSFAAYDGKGFYRAWDAATVAQALEPFAS